MTIGRHEHDGLIVGDYPLKAKEIQVEGPAEFRRGDVVAITNAGDYVLAEISRTDGGGAVVGIITDNFTADTGETKVSTMYVKGEFNQRALRFGGNDTTADHIDQMTRDGLLVRETRV